MTDGPCIQLHHEPQNDVPLLCLNNFALWMDLNPPTVATITGMLNLLGNALYRHELFDEGSEIKHIVHQLRDRHDSAA